MGKKAIVQSPKYNPPSNFSFLPSNLEETTTFATSTRAQIFYIHLTADILATLYRGTLEYLICI
jgi:hypothetical protein